MPGNVAAGQSFVPAYGLEAWPLDLPSTLSAWYYDAPSRVWRTAFTGELASLTDLPATLSPGEAIFVQADAPTELSLPEPASRILHYHQDHLGSSSAITDANGQLVEETANYPFGVPRHEHRLRAVEHYYGFTEKEQDRESGLHYFEARYLNSVLARFLSPDPKYASPDGLSADNLSAYLTNPQGINLYSYGLNNPLKYTDPTGLDWWIPFRDSWDELDVGQTVVNMYGPLGGMAAQVSNFVGGTDLDTRSLVGQTVSELTGSEKAGTYTEDAIGFVAGGGGVRATVKGVVAIVKNPGAFLKGSWSAFKHDLRLLIKPKPGAAGAGNAPVSAMADTAVGPPSSAAPKSARHVAKDAAMKEVQLNKYLSKHRRIEENLLKTRQAELDALRDAGESTIGILNWADREATKVLAAKGYKPPR